jgi:hypothetical protein
MQVVHVCCTEEKIRTCKIISNTTTTIRSWDSSVSIATGYGLDDLGGGSLSPGRVKNFHYYYYH